MSLSMMRPPLTRMYFASWPPISMIDRSAPRLASQRMAAVAWATISLRTAIRSSASE
ncbi:MAG: hypothetical protein QM765_41930 [Myxococcales bacterium]